MTQSERRRIVFAAAVGAVTTIGLLAGSGDAFAARRKKKQVKPANVASMQTPLGLQGKRGAGNNVVTPFSLIDRSRRKSDIEAQYGLDVNGDGIVADGSDPNLPSEYFDATEDRRDSRNTRKNKKPQLFSTAGDIGSSHAFVWNSGADISSGHFPTLQILFTPQGRPVPDPNNPGSFLFDDAQAGVKLRIRAKSRKRGALSAWSYSDAFALNNNTPPSMTIDDVVPNTTSTPTASDEVVEFRWTAFDDDSEDKNGNGVLDPLDLEDENGNGILDSELVAVAFDYWRVPEGTDPTGFSPDQLAALIWQPCTRAAGFGDTDDGAPSAPEGVGIQHTFAWDSLTDVGTVNAHFILRAKPFDEKKESGAIVYFADGFVLDNHTVFHHPNSDADLAIGRVGTASVNLVPGLARSDPSYEPPLQSFLVTGGATIADGPGTTSLTVNIVNTETAETTTASAVPFTSMIDARSYHTATLLDDGRVLMAGGFDAAGNPLATTGIYDPASHSVTPGPQLLQARAKHAAVRLASGDVLIVGGVGAGGQAVASAERVNVVPFGEPQVPNSALPDMAVAQHSLHATLLPTQGVLVAGGISSAGAAVQTAQVLDTLRDLDADPTTKDPDWITVGSMQEARKFASVTPLTQGHVLFAGGAASPSKSTMELFNWKTNAFESVSVPMPDGGRAQHAAALLGNGWVLLAGGTTDIDTAGSGLIAAADVFELGARNDASSSWGGRFLPVNGDMKFPRRNAETVTINNGRVFIIGGQNATGGALAALETYTPRGGLNQRPSGRTDLESNQQSWAFGAPIVYRVTDPEQNDVRVVVQWSDNGGTTWHAAAAQPSTIGGDVAEDAAPVSTGTFDDEALKISPRSFPQSDHQYIWAMTRDIPRPPPGGSSGPYVFRTIPIGAVQGSAAQSVPVTVLFNTKVIPTIIPLESRDGVLGAQQGGDINIWVHLRDIDGEGAPPSNGDPAEALFQYAVDENGDGIINEGVEFWNAMSRSGAGKFPDRRQDNRLTGLMTYSESFDNSGPEVGARDPAKGWAVFHWDSVFDLGAPQTSRGDVFVRVRPFDNLTAPEPDEGFTAKLFNEPLQPESIRIVRDPEALWLSEFRPAAGNANSVSVYEPLELHFNGLVDPTTVNDQTIQIRRGGVPILGVFTTAQDPSTFTTLVTFFPRPNSTDQDALVYSEQDNPTVLFPFNTYTIFMPGYHAGDDVPLVAETLLPDLSGFGTAPDETFRLVQNVEILTSFTTGAGNYDDGSAATVALVSPIGGSTLTPPDFPNGITLSYSKGIDIDTVASPNVTITVDNNSGGPTAARATAPVVPVRRTITNTQDPVTGLVTSTVQFIPMIHLPSGRTIDVQTFGGLLGANGRPVEASTLSYTVSSYGTRNVTTTEDFATADFEDDGVTNRAAWGTDPCAAGVLTGLQASGTPPQGGTDLVVADGQVTTITNAVNDYDNITVQKGGTLRIRAAGAVTIRATGDITIAGTVDFRGESGWTGTNGNASGTSGYITGTTTGTVKGGLGFNGGGAGGKSALTTSTSGQRVAGANGVGPSFGQGGLVAGPTTRYFYGAGGGAGAGHGAAGMPGGRAAAQSSSVSVSNGFGLPSTPGATNGDPDMIAGPSAGSGGGGGASVTANSNWHNHGGGGGAGGGSIFMVCGGQFSLQPSGYIDGRGGDGGGSAHYAGSGGGGSGGGLKIRSGDLSKLDGVIDLRGGKGGPATTAYFSDWYNRYQTTHGTSRHGGDGGPGRLVVESPSFASVADVRVKGQLMVQKISTLPTTTLPVSTTPSQFLNGGSIDYGTASAVHYGSLVVGAGKVVDLTGTSALTIYADTIDVQGTLRVNGREPPWGFTSARTGGVSGTAPIGDYASSSSSTPSPPTQYIGAKGNFGGGNGGDGQTNSGSSSISSAYRSFGKAGSGPQPGTNVHQTSSPGWNSGSTYYYSGDAGGGGGGNATPGDSGWAPYVIGGRYNYVGFKAGENNGRSPADVAKDVGNGGGRTDPTNLTVASLANGVGSGGGGGNDSMYSSVRSGSWNWNYFGMNGSAGSAAGALAMVGSDTLTVSGSIEAKGGSGNLPGGAYLSARTYANSGGGAGSGGTVMLVGDTVTISPVTNINDASSGATFELTGGIGGGRRQQYRNSSTISRYPTYNSFGTFGGDGGYGRLIVQYTTQLNSGATLFNRGGMEHVGFDDNNRVYTVLAGTARAHCLGGNNGGGYRSTWYDLDSLSPVVNGVSPVTIGANTTFTIQGEGAQSDPHDPGPGGIGVADDSSASGMQSPALGFLNGYRFFRFGGTISRTSTDPTKPPPVLDNVGIPHVTDDLP